MSFSTAERVSRRLRRSTTCYRRIPPARKTPSIGMHSWKGDGRTRHDFSFRDLGIAYPDFGRGRWSPNASNRPLERPVRGPAPSVRPSSLRVRAQTPRVAWRIERCGMVPAVDADPRNQSWPCTGPDSRSRNTDPTGEGAGSKGRPAHPPWSSTQRERSVERRYCIVVSLKLLFVRPREHPTGFGDPASFRGP